MCDQQRLQVLRADWLKAISENQPQVVVQLAEDKYFAALNRADIGQMP